MLNLTNTPASKAQLDRGVIDPPGPVATKIQEQMGAYAGTATSMQLDEIARNMSTIAVAWSKSVELPRSGAIGIPVLIEVKWGLTEKLETALIKKGFIVHRTR